MDDILRANSWFMQAMHEILMLNIDIVTCVIDIVVVLLFITAARGALPTQNERVLLI